MSRLSPAFVLGYHGCDAALAERVFAGKDTIHASRNDHDWLGSGTYFWEADEARAMKWAQDAVAQGKIAKPAVVGAIIDLRNCLQLTTQDGVSLLIAAYNDYRTMRQADGQPLHINHDGKRSNGRDRLIRQLDNAVIERLHIISEGAGFPAFDTVRAMFREGKEAYPGAGFWEKTHVQIAVRNLDCIIGFFRPRKLPK